MVDKFVIKPMKYTTVNIHNYKDYTANICFFDDVSSNAHQNQYLKHCTAAPVY